MQGRWPGCSGRLFLDHKIGALGRHVLKLGRRPIAEGGVEALVVVVAGGVVDHGAASLFACLIDLVDPLMLEASEDALDDGVVPTIAFAAHALHRTMVL